MRANAARRSIWQGWSALRVEVEALDGVTELLGLSDDRVLIRAREHGQVIVTHNRGDFCRLGRAAIASGEGHNGLILLTGHIVRIGWLADHLERIATEAKHDDALRNQELWL